MMGKKIVLVTGVSRGIGRSIVDELFSGSPEGGVIVYGVARSEGPLEEIRARYGDSFQYISGDISEEAVLDAVVGRIVDEHGQLDSVISNAGVLEPVADVNSIDLAAWKKLYDVNFFSIVNLVSKTIKLVSAQKGSYVFVSSGASVKPYNGWGAYGSSKAALNHFAMTLAAEQPQVGVISVAPGVVNTQMQVDIREKFGPSGMTTEALKRFTDLHKNNELLDSSVPAKIYANLAVRGIPKECNGQYLRYNDDKLQSFSS